MEFSLRMKSITRRWITNVLLVVAAAVLVVIIVLSVTISNYYYNSVASYLDNISSSFGVLSTYDADSFSEGARQLAEQFPYKERVEIQIIDSSGGVVVSTSGFPPEPERMPDYDAAVSGGRGSGSWTGRSSTGERVMAHCALLADYGKGANGAIRCVTSLSRVDRQIALNTVVIVAVGLAALAFAIGSGVYFINSIVRPVHEVGNIARKIALGDFKARIEVQRNDEIGELCDTINYMAAELGEAENMKNDFISSVSHELRTPLTAIKGWGETVKDAIHSDRALVVKGVDIILRESERLSGLVEELLDFSRMQSGRLSLRMERVDILAELGEAVLMYEDPARRAGLVLSYHEPEAVPPVIGDPDRLEQVFINVIDNAVKYTKSGGAVNVDVTEEEGCVQIRVVDTGVGIPAQSIDRVKEKFYKANKTVRGSGIGLAMADEIVKQHNGLLFLESKEGVGTTVTIVLPTETPGGEKSADPADVSLALPQPEAAKELAPEPAAQEPENPKKEKDYDSSDHPAGGAADGSGADGADAAADGCPPQPGEEKG